jgi:serpin B
VATLARSVNAFTCDLYGALRKAPGNLISSPLSVSAATGLAYVGAGGTTRSEMRSVLHLPPDDAQTYEGYRSLFAHLDEQARAGGLRWSLANRMWVEDGTPLLPAFVRTTRESFASEMGKADFQREPETARATMNQWVEKATEGQIRDLFPPGSINPMTRLVLANAVYFKGRWDKAFDKNQRRPETFHLSAGATTTAPMMFLTHRFGLAHIAGGRVLELPYRGGELSMLVLLPDAVDGLAKLENRLGADSLGTWISLLQDREVHVGLPRFTATSEFTLSETLAALGMPSAFDPKQADFSGMTGKRDLFISLVAHKAFVDVNEEGTEAAAATGEVMTVTTTTIEMPEEFLADRPFLFLIRDRASGCILFLGRVANPTL